MRPKAKFKWILDVLMTVGLLALMGYQFWGEAAHEWIGAGMFILFIAHHILNISWYKGLFRGKYTPARIFQLIIDILVLVAMLMLMYSGIVLSRYVFDFLPIDGGLMLARRLHILGSHWGFVLMSLHLGLHWAMVVGMVRKHIGPKRDGAKTISVIGFIISLAIAAYGAYVFVARDFLTYLLLKSEFVFLNYEESKILYYIDYLAMMGLFVFVAHYLMVLFRKIKGPRKENA